MPDACVDAAIIDPPGALGFCGKKWDGDMGGREPWVADKTAQFRAHARVVKPGRFVFVWSFPRTSHWTGLAIENAGLEIVDCFFHLFSHRRPSSPNLPKMACEMWWLCRTPAVGSIKVGSRWKHNSTTAQEIEIYEISSTTVRYLYRGIDGNMLSSWCEKDFFPDHFVPVTPGPGSKTPKSGSPIHPGIEACRIPAVQRKDQRTKASKGRHGTTVIMTHDEPSGEPCGAGCVVHGLDEMSGQLRSGTGAKVGKSSAGYRGNTYGAHCRPEGTLCTCYGDEGGASRFFSVLHNDVPFLYVNRASSKERNAGLPEGMENEGVAVKPIELMQHLVRLANVPKDGIVLDGFAGTGSTGCACALEGVRFIGVEQDKADAAVARRRIAHHYKETRDG
jgi:site-specific DNA-methyltransferase (adenine-specific)